MTAVGSNILTALGAGSGIDTTALVSSLVKASREPKEAAITSRQSLNSSRISALGSAVGSLDTFADALTQVLSDAAYTGSVNSNDTSIASVSVLSGGTPGNLPAQLTVKQLATARVLTSTPDKTASGTSPVGTGTLTITVGGVSTPVTATNGTYASLASAINAANTGVTARVVTDSQGTRLVFKGPTGAANDFSLTPSADATGVMAGLAFDATIGTGSLTVNSAPQNAQITLDGVDYEYAGNTIDGAIPSLRIDLNKAAPNTTVTLSMTQPTSGLSDLLKEFVSAYNTLMTALNTATAAGVDSSSAGVLNGVSAVRDMKRQLASITSTALSATGAYKTLADIGVATNRDGTLKLNTDQLARAMESDPEGVAKMVNPKVSTASNLGLAKLMDKVRDNIEKKDGPIKLAQQRYDDLATDFAEQLDKLDDQMSDYEVQLTKIYSAMETRLSALKATQSYLDQQVKVWTNSNND
jgi:flagellar hook-associated protein 2